ncbi:Lsr2 family protein [Nocardia thraciensis]
MSFGLDGATYEIDLSAANAARLREQVQQWADRARKVRRTATGVRQPTTMTAVQSTAARQWARENGVTVSARGRVPGEVLRAYLDAGRAAD